MKARIVSFFITAVMLSQVLPKGFAQSSGGEGDNIVKEFDDVVTRWDLLSSDLGSYEGLNKYCTEKAYQDNVIQTLNDIHHYDSLLYEKLARKARFGANHELKKTLQQIEEFETEFKGPSFLKKLHDECVGRREIEKNADETRNDIGMNSYDGQVLVLEADLNKYVVHITRLVDHIKDHIHHLNIE